MINMYRYSWGGGDNSGATYGTKETESPYCDDTSVKGFDCSGLAKYAVFQGTGISLPHNAQSIYGAGGQHIAYANAQPGDLIFYGSSTTSIVHVTIFAGSGYMVEAEGHYSNCTGMWVAKNPVRTSELIGYVARFW